MTCLAAMVIVERGAHREPMAPDALYHQLNKPYEPRSTDHGLNPNELYELPEPNEPRPPPGKL